MPSDAGSPFRDPDEPKFQRPKTREHSGEETKTSPPSPQSRRPPRYRTPRFEVGEAIGKSVSTFFSNFLPFTLLSLLVQVPVIVLAGMKLSPDLSRGDRLEILGLLSILSWGLSQILIGPVTYGVVMQLRGTRAPFGTCLVKGWSRLPHILLVAIVSGFLYMLPLFAGGLVMGLLVGSGGPLAAGFILLLVGLVIMLMIYTILSVAIPAVVCERPGSAGLGAISRSTTLTRGHRWGVFGSLFAVGILAYIAERILSAIIQLAAGASGGANPALAFVIGTGVGAIGQACLACVPATIYFLLRREKEGVEIEELAAVFD